VLNGQKKPSKTARRPKRAKSNYMILIYFSYKVVDNSLFKLTIYAGGQKEQLRADKQSIVPHCGASTNTYRFQLLANNISNWYANLNLLVAKPYVYLCVTTMELTIFLSKSVRLTSSSQVNKPGHENPRIFKTGQIK